MYVEQAFGGDVYHGSGGSTGADKELASIYCMDAE
jgi:hypothetical protein